MSDDTLSDDAKFKEQAYNVSKAMDVVKEELGLDSIIVLADGPQGLFILASKQAGEEDANDDTIAAQTVMQLIKMMSLRANGQTVEYEFRHELGAAGFHIHGEQCNKNPKTDNQEKVIH